MSCVRAQGAVVIIGGGIIGCLTAWFLRRLGHKADITVVERDPTYAHSSTARSAASIRTQFACPINVELSLFGADFLRRVKIELGPDAEVDFREQGYLVLGGPEAAPARRAALLRQRELGADVRELPAAELQRRYPWLSTDGVAIATLGVRDEGWFDAWSLLQAARAAARRHEVRFVTAEAVALERAGAKATELVLGDGERLAGAWFVNAAGAWAGRVASWVGCHLPVSPRKRSVFHFQAPLEGPGFPMLFDTSGAWCRPEGDGFIGGIQPAADLDPDAWDDFEPHADLFETAFWPAIAARAPAFERVRLLYSWAGHYEMNTFDHNGVVGRVAETPNLLLAAGFSGHGVMHAPGVARGVAELIRFGAYRSLDLAPLGHDRIASGRPLAESVIY
jgi:FAD-dependent oxidoreductase domain-containing protein 1